MEEKRRRGRPRKTQVVEGQAVVVAEHQPVVIQPSREDRREAARDQRKRERMRRKAERAAMAVWLLNRTAEQLARESETTDDGQPFQEKRSSKAARAARAKAEQASLDILEELSGKLKDDLW